MESFEFGGGTFVSEIIFFPCVTTINKEPSDSVSVVVVTALSPLELPPDEDDAPPDDLVGIVLVDFAADTVAVGWVCVAKIEDKSLSALILLIILTSFYNLFPFL
ncbi:hypothetical protein [Pectinatus frisingensis]|uniref:hypothetical protein n=1 Tax=Pectinatus frisingensis TaxID=865 RepID=UPI0018C702D1|nr:hypothetical protein [Pectinatus frisingensis]